MEIKKATVGDLIKRLQEFDNNATLGILVDSDTPKEFQVSLNVMGIAPHENKVFITPIESSYGKCSTDLIMDMVNTDEMSVPYIPDMDTVSSILASTTSAESSLSIIHRRRYNLGV